MDTFSRNSNTHNPPKVNQALHCTSQYTAEREGTPSVCRRGPVVTPPSGPCPRRMGHRRSRSVRVISLVATSTAAFSHKMGILRPRLPVVGEDDMWSHPAPFYGYSFKARAKERESVVSSLSGVQVQRRPRVWGEYSMNATYRFPDSAGQSSWVYLPVGHRSCFRPFCSP